MSDYTKQSQASEFTSRSAQSQHYEALQHAQVPFDYSHGSHYPNTDPTGQARPARSTGSRGGGQPPHSHGAGIPDQIFVTRPYEPSQPQVISSSPRTGAEGVQFNVLLQSSSTDLTQDTSRQFRLLFGSKRCMASLKKVQSGQPDMYQLSASVPAHTETGWENPEVSVHVVIEDNEGQELGTLDVGQFFYSSPSSPRRKRKLSEESSDPRGSAKRAVTQSIRPKSESYSPYSYPGTGNQYGSAYNPSAAPDRSYGIYPGNYEPSPDHNHSPGFPPAAAAAAASPRYQISFPRTSENSQQPGIPVAAWPSQSRPVPSGAHTPVSPGADYPNPQLVRTSTLQQGQHGGTGGAGGGAPFNPYSSLSPHKAVLKIQGDLAEMSKNWSTEEWDNRRRLVQFWREQRANEVYATFKPVAPNERPPQSICVSCIWWEEKRECYVTSVDCISLLESLIGVRFTVEEKNRIRRNLEGFRPSTVSKAKAESESFFKLIMGFPSPKPRHIEKDVKVFPWSVLPLALRKIVSKYSASYSSTASVISPPNASVYSAVPPPPPPPPPPSKDSTQLDTRSVSSLGQQPAPVAPISTSGVVPRRLSVGTAPLTSTLSPVGRVSSVEQHQSLAEISSQPVTSPGIWAPAGLPAVPSRSWEVASTYLDSGPASAPPGSSQAMYYQREPLHADEREPVSAGAQPSQHL